jgi:hypothetical protein
MEGTITTSETDFLPNPYYGKEERNDKPKRKGCVIKTMDNLLSVN